MFPPIAAAIMTLGSAIRDSREPMILPAQFENSASLAHLDLEHEIARLKRDMNAVILAHYYQESEIQDLADFVATACSSPNKPPPPRRT